MLIMRDPPICDLLERAIEWLEGDDPNGPLSWDAERALDLLYQMRAELKMRVVQKDWPYVWDQFDERKAQRAGRPL